jgi:hypothetical protein
MSETVVTNVSQITDSGDDIFGMFDGNIGVDPVVVLPSFVGGFWCGTIECKIINDIGQSLYFHFGLHNYTGTQGTTLITNQGVDNLTASLSDTASTIWIKISDTNKIEFVNNTGRLLTYKVFINVTKSGQIEVPAE